MLVIMHTRFCFPGEIWQARSRSLTGIWHENNCKVSICRHTHIDLTITLNHSIWQFNFSSAVFIWKQPPPMEASASLPSSVLQLCCHSLLSSLNSVSVIVRPGWSPWLLPSAMFSAPVVIRSFSDAKPISLFPCWAHLNGEPARENTQSMVTIKRGIK